MKITFSCILFVNSEIIRIFAVRNAVNVMLNPLNRIADEVKQNEER